MGTTHPFIKYRYSFKPPLSQAALARQIGISRSAINRIEDGTRRIGIELLQRASEATGLPPSVLRPDLKAVLK